MKKQIDRFVLRDALGEGGGASIYRAEEQLAGGLAREVALKVFPPIAAGDKAAETRLANELRPMALLSGHPNIVCLYASGISDGIPWIAMEHLPMTLASRLAETPANPADVSRLIEHVATGLAAMHGAAEPILHNDIKPGNILLTSWGTHKIADFGVASPVAMEKTRAVTTVRYAAPELLSREFGKVCPATDLYALGHVAYELALGQRLYRQQFASVFEGSQKEAHPAKWMAWHCSISTPAAAVHDLIKEFPVAVGAVIARLMTKALSERYGSAADVLTDLRAASGGGPVVLGPVAPSIPAAPPHGAVPAGGAGPLPVAPLPVPAGGAGVSAGPMAQPGRPVPRFQRPGGDRAAHAGGSPGAGASPPPAHISPKAPPQPKGHTVYFVRLREKRGGPFDLATLQKQAKQGLISRLHQVSTDGVTWQSASTVPGLFA